MEMINGYVFLDLTKSNVYAKALKVLGADKPVVIKEGGGSPYFVDSLTLDGTNVVITKGGKTIIIANDNTITNVGDIQPLIENIVDVKGNKRFIEGDGEILTEIEGLTITYNKWSLSGTHLMFVVAGSVANGTEITANPLISYDLPEWIFDKIYATFGTIVESKTINLYASNYTSQQIGFNLSKDTIVKINIGTLTLSADRSFRLQFDLLIDAE